MDVLSQLHLSLIFEDTCPKCLGVLDEGWECNRCGYDAYENVATSKTDEREDEDVDE